MKWKLVVSSLLVFALTLTAVTDVSAKSRKKDVRHKVMVMPAKGKQMYGPVQKHQMQRAYAQGYRDAMRKSFKAKKHRHHTHDMRHRHNHRWDNRRF